MSQQLPLHTYFHQDAFCTVSVAQADQTVGEFAASVAALVVGRRIRAGHERRLRVTYNGKSLDSAIKVGEAGLRPFDRVNVGYE